MSQERASIFDDATLDLSEFEPKPSAARAARPKPDKRGIREVAEKRGFSSREPEPAATLVPPASPAAEAHTRQQRRRITGRNKQFNLKAKEETIQRFYAIADTKGWGLGETLEQAVEALEKALSKAK